MLSRRTFTTIGLTLAGTLAGFRLSAEPTATSKRFEIMKSDDEWKKQLTAEQFYVLRQHGTERAGTSPLDKIYEPGMYQCAGCNAPLFSSKTKYDSGTGWPSFWEPLKGSVGTKDDSSFFMTRTEVHCARCGGHLGHVFDDGPQPTGQRYCMNGVAMSFVPEVGKGS